ncbi:unnamed protein product [Merluccius merluccius]
MILNSHVVPADAFPVDEVDGDSVRTVRRCVFSRCLPTPLKAPISLAAVSQSVVEDILDLDIGVTQTDDFLQYVSGAKLIPGSRPLAHRYGGHQSMMSSLMVPRRCRSGDGRAVVRSSVREFLCSEAMRALGIATSRAASLVVSEESVWRDQFYNGNVKKERGAVVLRLARSWFRIGSLEVLTRAGELDLLRSGWVCNTDNFSLLSITIDYGPFGFMEAYDPNFVPNTSDAEGLYSVGAQADAGRFNVEKLLEALRPLLSPRQQQQFHQLFKAKLGLLGEEEEDEYLIAFLLKMMEDTGSDFTMTFRQLSEAPEQQLRHGGFTQETWALHDLSSHKLFSDWSKMYLLRLGRQEGDGDEDRRRRMKRVNPRYVLRNWMAESAIGKAEANDFSEVVLLTRILGNPFVRQDAAEETGYAARPPLWAQRLKVSCSS